jgi:hypothetical protein
MSRFTFNRKRAKLKKLLGIRARLPAEFIPLARAFNAMAAQLTERERELVATNDRLTVMASCIARRTNSRR